MQYYPVSHVSTEVAPIVERFHGCVLAPLEIWVFALNHTNYSIIGGNINVLCIDVLCEKLGRVVMNCLYGHSWNDRKFITYSFS